EQAGERGEIEGALVRADAGPDLIDDAEARAQRDRHSSQSEQRAHFTFALSAEEDNSVDGGGRRPGERGKRRGAICRHYTRSLDFSAIRPVGRQVMMAMMTASANTSL